MEKQITFKTKTFGHLVECYLKGLAYDVYLCGKCIKINASLDQVRQLKKILV